MVMMKKIFILMGVALMVTAFSSCSDENTSGGSPTAGSNYNYSVSMSKNDHSWVVIVDSITGNVSDITCSESWLKAIQDGMDGGEHPVMQLSVSDNSNQDRTAYVTFKSSDNQQVCITVVHKGDTGGNDDDDELPQVSPLNKAFYENWYNGDNKEVYITVSQNKQTWNKYRLPWFDNALGSVPAYVSEEMKESKADWRLVYSTLGLSSTPGANFFILHNSTQGKFRFFYFIPENAVNDASTACFILDMSNKSGKFSMALNSNESIEMPDKLQNSGIVTLQNNYNPSGMQSLQIVPLGTDSQRAITSGWACFDLLADHGYTKAVNEALEDPNTSLQLRLVTTLQGNIDLLASLNTTGDIDMSGVSLVKKGSSLAAAATFFTGFGTSLFQIGGGVANVADGGGKKAGGILQIAGGVSTLVGTCLNTAAASKDSKQGFEGSASVELKTNGKIEGTLTFNTINNVPAIKFRPAHFKYKWETLLSGNPQTRADENTLPIYGLLTLTDTPVVYMSEDHLLYTPAQYPAEYELDYDGQLVHCVTGDDEQLRYISFLDPSSIGVYINKEMMGFDFDEVDVSVSLVANVGPYDEYVAPNPYFGFYQLKNNQIQLTTQDDAFITMFSDEDTKSMKLVACSNSDIPTITKDPELDAQYVVSELTCNDNSTDTQESGFTYRYYGLTGEMFSGTKKIVVDPIVYVPTNKDRSFLYNKSHLGPMFVSVFARLTKGNTMQIITKHFLPEIRTYKSSEVSKLRNSINQCNPTTVQTNTFNMPATFLDIDWQKKRALKMLDLSSK